ncbi:MAG: carbamate kinase [Chloroflexi bacterium]|nr:MAG: carbamate kinase [Chloroflexota bacterium]
MPDQSPLAVVAIGGNSLIQDNKQPEVANQWDAVRETTGHIAGMVEKGWRTVITHGNGPQVGFILRRNELAAHEVHTTPLSLIVADTQGAIGYMLQQALNNEFFQRGISKQAITVVTQVRVDENDAAFANPSKPIGGFLDEETARIFERTGWQVVEDAGRGWRRVIASPLPIEIVELAAIRQAIELGWIVVACGGGGIPVVRNPQGELRGVSAVIDKDRASSLLARQLGAELFLISTGVEQVAINFGKPNQQSIDAMTLAQARRYREEGHFAAGSMRPKIDACIEFLEESSNPAAWCLITDPRNLERALEGETGTRIVRT